MEPAERTIKAFMFRDTDGSICVEAGEEIAVFRGPYAEVRAANYATMYYEELDDLDDLLK